MKNFYREFFYVSKHEKIRDKVMLTQVISTVAIIICCLIAMSITAYAHFSCNVSSYSNVIRAANFETDIRIQITDDDGNAVSDSQIIPTTSDNKNFEIRELEVGKYYTVTIKPTEQSTAKTGFVAVTAGGCKETYHTQQLAKDVNAKGGETTELSFKLMITDSTIVYLKAHWGTSSYYDGYNNENEEFYIAQDEEIKMIINGIENPPVNNTEDKTENTTDTEITDPPSTEDTTSLDETVTSETEETDETTSETDQTQSTDTTASIET